MSSIVSVKAVGWRRSVTERYFTAGSREALFLKGGGGGGTPSCQRLLPVMDQLPVTEEENDSCGGH